MIGNPRFWLALILYFAAAALSAGIRAYRKKKSPRWQNLYLILAVTASIGLWVYAGSESYRFIEVFNLVNLFCLLFGVLTGLGVYFLPFLIILPILFSQIYKVPLAPFLSEEERILGELCFYPSNKGDVTVGWITGEKEDVISLKGEKAGILFVRKSVAPQYFFLRNYIYPLAILSESHTVADLAHADPEWYYSLTTGQESESPLYQSSFPAVKYHGTGFFTSYSYSVEKGRIVIMRN
ncbi:MULTISPECIES: hypothetical protein [unclassified Oceanispirochaeta]|uniref:hypothetical protein n=1 Tax=unclassified Oceanispirochaeta TaxID=2635722 RepID=UPI000E08EC29|nr:MULTISPECIES: hypothetical protein [unclassified Oceanispirochaeta]MBF9014217.1 hypothetical protein [Oceanispirochaeta sp. M2]NPD71103.1 hypothetical protein [Oceanispirochaeta sp. M1]RDG33499.1 hypothetical protein DV872_03240 [Oceanispirochaeta sp. M1]